MFKLGKRSKKNLIGVHPDLVKVVELAIKKTSIDFTVIEGVRTKERQQQLFDAGASQTMNSRHLSGQAVDLAALIANKVCWKPAPYDKMANAMLQAAAELQIPIIWGGSWVSFKDLVHFELNRKFYKGE